METMIDLNKELFEHYVPAFKNADTQIFDRMAHFFENALSEVTALMGGNMDKFLGESVTLLPSIQEYVCTDAAYQAIPQLDLVLTETGFGVVSTGNVAPASRERVQALVEHLRQQSSKAHDHIVNLLLLTSWKETEEAKRTVNSLFFLSSHLRGVYRYDGKEIFREELKKLRPKIDLAEAYVKNIISKELFEELLVRLRTGKNEAAYELVRHRAQSYILAFLDNQPIKEFKRILIETTESLSESLPEYTNSSVYSARHDNGYENRQSDPVFFMS